METDQEIAVSNPPQKGPLTINCLKYIAVLAMLIDHIALSFVHNELLLIVMRFIGKTAGPLMFYAAVEGYHHTRNIGRYIFRLFVFAAISYFPFIYFEAGGVFSNIHFLKMDVIYTILLGVLAIKARREIKNKPVKLFLVMLLITLCIPADWGTAGIIMMLVFDFYYGNRKNQLFGYALVVLLYIGVLELITYPASQLIYHGNLEIVSDYYKEIVKNTGMLLPIIPIFFYAGEKGRKTGFSKWFFYIFYPAHLLILGFLRGS
ncbi:conjugal transfer protein TraX [Brucepastera parasyntrophica]|uniref:TraX family protein n=1 Tax=Brucepastera parasyntrophica TaxID=2880008 RepID=UPI00210C8A61|nr:TraX family protein [Brucepastera parasyntrophica]ULQ58927.1 conjugal transfer protein TraX [Brucepastera parasyntrophica]